VKKAFIIGFSALLGILAMHWISSSYTHPSISTNNHIAWWENTEKYQTTFQEDFTSKGREPNLDSLQCPIPIGS